MFTIYRKIVGGRKFDRYFRSWDRAEEELEKERHDLLESGWKEISHRNRMNVEKGFYLYDYTLKTPKGEDAELTLLDGFFSD